MTNSILANLVSRGLSETDDQVILASLLVQGHTALVRTIYYFARWNMLSVSEEAEVLVRQLRQQRIRIGSQDLRITALALLYDFTVVTSNVRDFAQVPNLNIVDWTVTPQ